MSASRRHPITLILAILAGGLVLAAPGAAAPAVAPDLDALLRHRAEAFVAAMNASGEGVLEAFTRDHMESRLTRDGLIGKFVEGRRRDVEERGPIEKHSIRILADGAVLFVTCRHATIGAWLTYQFRVHAEDEHRLELVFVAIAVEPMERPASPIDSEESRAWLEKFRVNLEEQQPFSGVVLVRTRDRDVYTLIEGMADASKGTPMKRDTRLNMASGSKLFTAVAILQLAQGGRLTVDDTLSRHLPDFPDRGFADRVTLHQLLTHTAGAGNYWDEAYEREWGAITELQQMLPFVSRHLGETPTGEFSYSNSGYILLGLVIEAVSGTDYYDYVDKHIFSPAGMRATGFPIRSDPAEDLAQAYNAEIDGGAVKPGTYVPVELGARGTSAGGAATTADDLMRFATALQQGALIDLASLDRMTTPHVRFEDAEAMWYGYGCVLETERGVTSFGHGGLAPGTQFELKIFPDSETVMVVMSNFDTIAPFEMTGALGDLIRNGKPASR